MAHYQAIGTGPVSFIDGNFSQQEIPLSAIFFRPAGIDASAWPSYSRNQAVVDALLQQMVSQGFLTPSTQPVASMTIAAASPGTLGNSITVTFSNAVAASGTFTVAVNVTQTYTGLTPASLSTVLQTTAAAAAGNSLVYLQSNNVQMPAAFTGTLAAASGTVTAFTLAVTNAADAPYINITITPVPSASPTSFTLAVAYSNTTSAPVTLTSLVASNPFADLVTFSTPSGPNGPLPAASSVTLQGGAAAIPTVATGIVLAAD